MTRNNNGAVEQQNEIKEIVKSLNEATFGVNNHRLADYLKKPESVEAIATHLYNAGYRKQSSSPVQKHGAEDRADVVSSKEYRALQKNYEDARKSVALYREDNHNLKCELAGKKGFWIEHRHTSWEGGGFHHECSNCHKEYPRNIKGEKYCSACGTNMVEIKIQGTKALRVKEEDAQMPCNTSCKMSSAWISVKDQLPQKGQKVLAYLGDFKGYIVSVYTYLGDDSWEDDTGYCESAKYEHITHWAHIPLPPTE